MTKSGHCQPLWHHVVQVFFLLFIPTNCPGFSSLKEPCSLVPQNFWNAVSSPRMPFQSPLFIELLNSYSTFQCSFKCHCLRKAFFWTSSGHIMLVTVSSLSVCYPEGKYIFVCDYFLPPHIQHPNPDQIGNSMKIRIVSVLFPLYQFLANCRYSANTRKMNEHK